MEGQSEVMSETPSETDLDLSEMPPPTSSEKYQLWEERQSMQMPTSTTGMQRADKGETHKRGSRKRGRETIKFPFGEPGWFISIRPLHGVDEELGNDLLELIKKKFECCIVAFEMEGEKRHLHAIVNYKGKNSNLRRIFKTYLEKKEVEGNKAMIRIDQIKKTPENVVGYVHKDGEPAFIRGFQKTWIDQCVDAYEQLEKRKKTASTATKVYADNAWEVVKEFAKDAGIPLECGSDLPGILVEMNKCGYLFVNRKKVADTLRQRLCTLDDFHDKEREKQEWSFLLGQRPSL